MDLADPLRQFPTEDEDLKVIQVLAMRTFNAFGTTVKLALSGYGQNAALVMRDILETVFLLDLFRSDPDAIERWRLAERADRMREFSPRAVREALDKRDGFASGKRAELYRTFSELAGHPTMTSVLMMRPQVGGDAVIGPFIEATSLQAVISEMGRLAFQVGEALDRFFPETWTAVLPARESSSEARALWLAAYPR